MKRAWTYEEVCQLYNELATYNNEDNIIMWQPTNNKERLNIRPTLYTNLDWEVMERHSKVIIIGTEDNEAVATLWSKE